MDAAIKSTSSTSTGDSTAIAATLAINRELHPPLARGKTGSWHSAPLIFGRRAIHQYLFLASLLALMTTALAVHAQSGTWTNNFNDGVNQMVSNWGEPTNWLDGIVADGDGNAAYFTSDIRVFTNGVAVSSSNATVLLDSPRTIGAMTFGDADPGSPANWLVGLPPGGSSALTLSGPTPPVVTVNALGTSSNSATLGIPLTGTNGLVKAGPGTLILAGNNDYSGGTIISNGVVQINTNSWVGTNITNNAIIFYNGTLRNTWPTNTPNMLNNWIVPTGFTGTIEMGNRTRHYGASVSTAPTLTGGGTLNLIVRSDANRSELLGQYGAFTGTLNLLGAGTVGVYVLGGGFTGLSNGLLTVNAPIALKFNAIPTSQVEFGALSGNDPGATIGAQLFAGGIITVRIGKLGLDTEFAGAMVSPLRLVKIGTGTFTLTGTNSTSGITTITEGVLQIGKGGLTGSIGNGAGAVNNNSALVFNRDGQLDATNAMSGTGVITNLGPGTVLLGVSNSYSGRTVVKNGTLGIGAESSLGTNPPAYRPNQLLLDGGSLRSTATFSLDDTNRGITLGGNGGVFRPDNFTTLFIMDYISGLGALTQAGPGSIVLGQDNTYVGNTIINPNALLQIGTGGPTGQLGVGPIQDDGILVFNRNNDYVLSAQVSGTGLFVQQGPGTLIADGAKLVHSGETAIHGGTLAVRGIGSAALPHTSEIKIAGGVLDVSSLTDDTGTITNGNLILGSTSGQLLSGAGLLQGSVTVAAQGTISPGEPIGTFTITNAMTNLNGLIVMELNRTNGQTSDRLIAQTIKLGGTLTVTNIGPDLQPGDSFQLFSGTIGGNFNVIVLPSLSTGLTWDTTTLYTTGSITVSGNVPEPKLGTVIEGNTLKLSWPAELKNSGWELQVQTNDFNVGLSTNWITIIGSQDTNEFTVPIDVSAPTVFYRLAHP